MPNRISPPTPASAASTAALRRLSLVCWATPGMDGTGTGSAIPSLTNSGSTRSEPRTLEPAAGATPALAGLADRLAGRDGRVTEAGAVLGQRLGEGGGGGFRRQHVDAQPVLGGG